MESGKAVQMNLPAGQEESRGHTEGVCPTRSGGSRRERGTDLDKLPRASQTASGELPHATGSPARGSATTSRAETEAQEGGPVCILSTKPCRCTA